MLPDIKTIGLDKRSKNIKKEPKEINQMTKRDIIETMLSDQLSDQPPNILFAKFSSKYGIKASILYKIYNIYTENKNAPVLDKKIIPPRFIKKNNQDLEELKYDSKFAELFQPYDIANPPISRPHGIRLTRAYYQISDESLEKACYKCGI